MSSDTVILICTIIGTGIAVIGSVISVVMYYVHKEKENAINLKRLEDVEAKAYKLPCNNHHSDIIAIKSILIQKYPISANVFSMKASPRRLNNFGEKLFEDIKGREFLENNKEVLFKEILKNNPLTALDVEQYSYSSLLLYTTTPMFNKLKDYVYNAPAILLDKGEKYEIVLNDICFVLSIPLRDMFLKAYPNITDFEKEEKAEL